MVGCLTVGQRTPSFTPLTSPHFKIATTRLDTARALWQECEQMEELPLHKTVNIQLRQGKFGPSFVAPVEALNLKSDLKDLSALILDEAANFRAMELASKLAASSGTPFGAVYLIAAEDMGIVKVGVATDPRFRLCTLQIGNWHQLFVKGLLWVDSGAGGIERLVHRAAKEMDISIRGEWIEASVEQAAELVLKAARYDKARCYDSAAWIKNWSSRVDALAESKGIRKRVAA